MLLVIAPAQPESKYTFMYGVCTSVCMQRESGNACVPRGRDMIPFKSIFCTEMTYLSNLLQTVPFYCERPENSHAS